MTTDDSLHLFGTRLVHQAPGWACVLVGFPLGEFFDWWFLVGVGLGMQLVMLFGNMRAQAPRYRWRVEKDEESEGVER